MFSQPILKRIQNESSIQRNARTLKGRTKFERSGRYRINDKDLTKIDFSLRLPDTVIDQQVVIFKLALKDAVEHDYEIKPFLELDIVIDHLTNLSNKSVVKTKQIKFNELTEQEQATLYATFSNYGKEFNLNESTITFKKKEVLDKIDFTSLLVAFGIHEDKPIVEGSNLYETIQDVFIMIDNGNDLTGLPPIYSLKQLWEDGVIDIRDLIDLLIGYKDYYLFESDLSPILPISKHNLNRNTDSYRTDMNVGKYLKTPKLKHNTQSTNQQSFKNRLQILHKAMATKKNIKFNGPESDYINFDVVEKPIFVNYSCREEGGKYVAIIPNDLATYLEINIIINNSRNLTPAIRNQLSLGSKVKPLSEELYKKYTKDLPETIECFVYVKVPKR